MNPIHDEGGTTGATGGGGARSFGELPAPDAPASAPVGAEGGLGSDLTPEEQMERFEEALKESDWGHQPC